VLVAEEQHACTKRRCTRCAPLARTPESEKVPTPWKSGCWPRAEASPAGERMDFGEDARDMRVLQ
jgi:hypothetical protein